LQLVDACIWTFNLPEGISMLRILQLHRSAHQFVRMRPANIQTIRVIVQCAPIHNGQQMRRVPTGGNQQSGRRGGEIKDGQCG
jgi:hypothetical protein